MKKQRLILVVGAETQEQLLAALCELGQDRRLESHGSIGVLRCGADFDYSLDCTDGTVSVASLFDEVRAGTWGKDIK